MSFFILETKKITPVLLPHSSTCANRDIIVDSKMQQASRPL